MGAVHRRRLGNTMGVNVCLWGEPNWRINFAIAQYADQRVHTNHRTSATLARWAAHTLRALCAVPPCPLCRRSCGDFLTCVRATMGMDLHTAVHARRSVEFLYRLRNCINNKLHAQHLLEHRALLQGSRITFSDHPKACSLPARTISLANVRKRLALQLQRVRVEDVVCLLHAYRQDYVASLKPQYRTVLSGLNVLCALEAERMGDNMGRPLVVVARALHVAATAQSVSFSRAVMNVTVAAAPFLGPLRRRTGETHAHFEARVVAHYRPMVAGVKCAAETCTA